MALSKEHVQKESEKIFIEEIRTENLEHIEWFKINMIYCMAREGYRPKTLEGKIEGHADGRIRIIYEAERGISQLVDGTALVYDNPVKHG